MMVKKIYIYDEYVTLGQFLKIADLISTGGEARTYLASHEITINGEKDDRRGRKLRAGDQIVVESQTFEVCR